MGKTNSKLKEEVVINNNAAVSSNVGIFSARYLSDFELIVTILAICIIAYVLWKKLREYLMKVVSRQVVAQNV